MLLPRAWSLLGGIVLSVVQPCAARNETQCSTQCSTSAVQDETQCIGPICHGPDYDPSRPPRLPFFVSAMPMLNEILRISEKDFSLYASYSISFFWRDDRLFVREADTSLHYTIDITLLGNFWVPKVRTLNVANSNIDKGLTFHHSSFAFLKLDGFLTAMLAVTVKPEITCPMKFNWFPFDSQQCHFVMSPYNPGIKLVNMLEKPERMEGQNIIFNYEIAFSNLPTHKKIQMYHEAYRPMIAKIYPNLTKDELNNENIGFTFILTRKYSKFIFLYIIPSSFCVISSWASFLVSPQIVPGRMGLLVTLFLSLTALLVSTISSSPEVSQGLTALTLWVLVHFLFIFGAILVYGLQLFIIRFWNHDERLDIEKIGRKIDKKMLLFFSCSYGLFNMLYWPICLNNI